MGRKPQFTLLAIGWLAFFAAGSASNALTFPANGSLGIQIATLPPIVLPGSFDVTVNGSGGGLHILQLTIPASPFSTSGLVVDVAGPPDFSFVEGLMATLHNSTVVASPTGTIQSPLQGPLSMGGIAGVTKICLFADCSSGFVPANLSFPVSVVGSGGSYTVGFGVNITVLGAPWTSGTTTLAGLTAMGSAHGAASATSSTAGPSGVVALVSPLFISTSIPGFAEAMSGYAFLNLHIVPEPGTLVLLGSGVVGMALLGRRTLRG